MRTALITASLLLSTAAMAAPPGAQQVCHWLNNGSFHTVTVGGNALASHLAHGDLAGSCDDHCATLCDDGDACTENDTGDCETQGCPTNPSPVLCDDPWAVCVPDSGCECAAGYIDSGFGFCEPIAACPFTRDQMEIAYAFTLDRWPSPDLQCHHDPAAVGNYSYAVQMGNWWYREMNGFFGIFLDSRGWPVAEGYGPGIYVGRHVSVEEADDCMNLMQTFVADKGFDTCTTGTMTNPW